ncbi:hypothetical protein ACIXGQ_22150 [Bacteroides fragilis]
MVIFLGTFIVAFVTFENLDRLKVDIKEKEYIINRYKTIVDNGELPTSYIAKGDSSIMTYQDLTKEYNRLLDERYKYSNEANRLKFYLDVIKSTYGIEIAIRNNTVYFTPSVADSALKIYPFLKICSFQRGWKCDYSFKRIEDWVYRPGMVFLGIR